MQRGLVVNQFVRWLESHCASFLKFRIGYFVANQLTKNNEVIDQLVMEELVGSSDATAAFLAGLSLNETNTENFNLLAEQRFVDLT